MKPGSRSSSMVLHWMLAGLLLWAVATPTWGGSDNRSLVVGLPAEPRGLDPTREDSVEAGEVTLYNVFETLTRVVDDGSVRPMLAHRWIVSPDGRKLTFSLRPSVRFHNGMAFNSRTARYSLTRAAVPESGNADRSSWVNITRIETPDELTLVLHLRAADPDLPFMLGKATAAMVEPQSAEGNKHAPVGTGPYRFGSWQRGSSVVLERWGGHRDAPSVALERVTFRFLMAQSTQMAALLAGDVDLLVRVDPARGLRRLAAERGFRVGSEVGGAMAVLAMNLERSPLNRETVRQALRSAIDRQLIVTHALGSDVAFVRWSGHAPVLVGSGTGSEVARDLQVARTLLVTAGVTRPLRLVLKVSSQDQATRIATTLASQVMQAGIQVVVEPGAMTQGPHEYFRRHGADMVLLAPSTEPSVSMAWPHARKVQELAARLQVVSDPGEQQRLGDALRQATAADPAALYLFQQRTLTVSHHRIEGLRARQPFPVLEIASLRWQ